MNAPLPNTFEDALKMCSAILSISPALQARGGIESESEQLVIAAFRRATGRGRTFARNDLYARIMDAFPEDAGKILIEMSRRRASGEPLQYIVGYQYFLNHEYEVNPNVLIPRPETEILVFEATQEFKRRLEQPTLGVEIGLGSGCISIELLKLFPGLRMLASEVSEGAMDVAATNAVKIIGDDYPARLTIVRAKKGEGFFDSIDAKHDFASEPADFLISNPPYLVSKNEADGDVLQYEPHEALFAPEEDALYFYRRIVEEAPFRLRHGGCVFFECPHERIEEILRLFGEGWSARSVADLTGRPRVVRAEWTGRIVLN